MQYTALYRKLRPRAFEAVVGQEHIVRTLKNQLATGRISHAYLFCGTRGTGKTSTAKIFARAVNCENLETSEAETAEGTGKRSGSPEEACFASGETTEACGTCQSCRAIDSGYSLNVIEIDAASNNSVDNVRDIREEVKYPPAEGKYKVYIIDEVHMLSGGAFNALLKTLEEPPEHVVFILATTDPQKIPATVHSRCQRFDFRRITAADIAQTLGKYSKDEGLDISEDALDYIARIADGAMRDALSLLDQCATFYFSQSITLENVLDIVGAVDDRVFFELADALYALDGGRVMEIIEELSARGRDISRFVSDFMAHLRNLLVARSVKEPCAALNLSLEAVIRLANQAGDIESDALMHYINVLSELQGQMRYAANGRILFEVCCLRLCSPVDDADTDMHAETRIDARLRKLESDVKSVKQTVSDGYTPSHAGIANTADSANARAAETSETSTASTLPPTLRKSVPDDIAEVCKFWAEFVKTITQKPLNSWLLGITPAYLDGNALMLVSRDAAMPIILKKYEADIKDALARKYEREFELVFISRAEYDERHKRIYGTVDKTEVFSPESFTEKLDMDIIFED